MPMKIFLIGMPGSGKTTVGQKLADKLLVRFIDLDKEIEEKEGMSVSEIFSQKGEDYFRLRESETLAHWASHPDSFVLSTGGGAPCFYNGIDVMNSSGLTVFLQVEHEELVERMLKKSDRPLLKSDSREELSKRLKLLAEQRLPIYSKAKIKVANATDDSVLEKILSKK
jgi:shikimate kinase